MDNICNPTVVQRSILHMNFDNLDAAASSVIHAKMKLFSTRAYIIISDGSLDSGTQKSVLREHPKSFREMG